MELSLVLWNCDGRKGTKGQSKSTVGKRNDVLRSTYNFWKQGNLIPTVVLAQELCPGLTETWGKRSKKSNSFGKCEAACFFLKGLGQEIEFLDIGDLQRIMGRILLSDDKFDGGIARIHCSIVTLGAEKILICSWNGQYKVNDDDDDDNDDDDDDDNDDDDNDDDDDDDDDNDDDDDVKKKNLLRKMLIFVDKVKEDQGCVAALVGGDFNLDKDKVNENKDKVNEDKDKVNEDNFILQSVQNAKLYGDYPRPASRTGARLHIVDYVIAWPENRFIERKSGEIETHPKENVNHDPKIFDHPLIKYDFIVNLKGEWEGEGLVKWGGECGEGEVTLTGRGDRHSNDDVEVTGENSGKWKGEGSGVCKNFEKLELIGGDSLEVKYGEYWTDVGEGKTLTLTSEICEKMEWKGNGQGKWKGAEVECKCFVSNNGEQTVTWKGTGSVEWRGKGKATWVGGKLEKWKGTQTVRCADGRGVQWNGNGEVELEGGDSKPKRQSTWKFKKFGVGKVRYKSKKSSELRWAERGVVWKVTGTGTGIIM